MTLGQRIMLTVIIVLVILFGLAAFGYFTGGWEHDENNSHVYGLASAETRPEFCMDEPTREQIRSVMLDALDTALKAHIVHAFEVWMRDDRAQPERARLGVNNGIRAYLQARKGALEWLPPQCAG